LIGWFFCWLVDLLFLLLFDWLVFFAGWLIYLFLLLFEWLFFFCWLVDLFVSSAV